MKGSVPHSRTITDLLRDEMPVVATLRLHTQGPCVILLWGGTAYSILVLPTATEDQGDHAKIFPSGS